MYASGYMASLKQHTGGAGGRPLVPPTYKNLCTQTVWGGWGVGPAALDHIYFHAPRGEVNTEHGSIYTNMSHHIVKHI